VQAQTTLFLNSTRQTKFVDYQETITQLTQCLKCNESQKTSDLPSRLGKVHLLIADVYHFADEEELERDHLQIALDYLRQDKYANAEPWRKFHYFIGKLSRVIRKH
jgi:hypothetical protein